MINTNTTNIVNNRSDTQRNKLDTSQPHGFDQRGLDLSSNHKTPKFQNSSVLYQIIQLITQLLRQLAGEKEQPKPEPKSDTETLDLSNKEQEAIKNRFGLSGEQGFSVTDKDGNKKLSAGDVVVVSGGFTGGHIRDITLTEADVKAINQSENKPLKLTQNQHDAISKQFNDKSPLAFDGLAIEYTGKSFDKDGDGKLSVGDVVKLREYGGQVFGQPVENFTNHVLTAAEVRAISNNF